MRNFLFLTLASALAFGTAVSHAQTTTTLTITPNVYTCFNFSAEYPLCNDIPITDTEGHSGSFWLHVSGAGSWTVFHGYFHYLGNPQDNFLDPITSYTYLGTTGNVSGSAQFKGVDIDGAPFTGTINYTAQTFVRCGHGCLTYAMFTGGSVTITYGGEVKTDNQLSSLDLKHGATPDFIPPPPPTHPEIPGYYYIGLCLGDNQQCTSDYPYLLLIDDPNIGWWVYTPDDPSW